MKIIKIAQTIDEELQKPDIYNAFLAKVGEHKISWQRSPDSWIHNTITHGETDAINNYRINYLGFMNREGVITNSIYSFKLHVDVDERGGKYTSCQLNLFINSKRYIHGQGEEIVGVWKLNGDREIKGSFYSVLSDKFGISALKLPHEIKNEAANVIVPPVVRMTKIKSRLSPAMALYIYTNSKRFGSGYIISYVSVNLETSTREDEKVLTNYDEESGGELSSAKAYEYIKGIIARSESNGFVGVTSPLYIPEAVNIENYDFIINQWKDEHEHDLAENDEPIEKRFHMDETLFGRNKNKMEKLSQDYQGFFSGEVPEYAADLIGTSSVDASQIKSMFGKVDDAIRLVNQFDSSLLSNISFIFNFSKGGAYGVYLSALDRAIKTKALEKRLESQGYRVETDDKGLLKAYPIKEQKTTEQIQQDIDKIYGELQSKGGSAFGINMNSVLQAAQKDASESESQDPNVWEWMALLHLGGTIVHEAVHAGGNESESPSEEAEARFTQWAIPIVNQEYQKTFVSVGHKVPAALLTQRFFGILD